LRFVAEEIAKTRQQKQFLLLVTNIMHLNFVNLKTRLLGARLLVKGKIGGHGRTKSFYFIEGRFKQPTLLLPVNFFFISTATYYGALGLRWWLVAKPNTLLSS
jgi:ribosomal protein S3